MARPRIQYRGMTVQDAVDILKVTGGDHEWIYLGGGENMIRVQSLLTAGHRYRNANRLRITYGTGRGWRMGTLTDLVTQNLGARVVK